MASCLSHFRYVVLDTVFTMVYCAAWGRSNRSEKGVHMYGFPKDRDRRKAWVAKVGRSNLAVTDKDFNNKKICEVITFKQCICTFAHFQIPDH